MGWKENHGALSGFRSLAMPALYKARSESMDTNLATQQLAEDEMLRVQDLCIEAVRGGCVASAPVKGVSFQVPTKQVTAIVGESGSGKTLTALAIMGLLPEDELRAAANSKIYYRGRDLLQVSSTEMNGLRGKQIAMVLQEPGSSLNPVISIGDQIALPLRHHLGMTRRQAGTRAEELLHEVGIPHPRRSARAYSHEFSGGQQQRVTIAMAIACGPQLIIADEPTSALDVTVQRQILDLFARLQRDHDLTLLFITHDLAIVAEIADRVVVFQHGIVKEQGEKARVLFSPTDAYTRALIASRSRLREANRGQEASASAPKYSDTRATTREQSEDLPALLDVRSLSKSFLTRNGLWKKSSVAAVRNVSFSLRQGETLGIVGESGSGKTTVAMTITRLIEASGGEVLLEGKDILALSAGEFRELRRRIQLVFQNPYASLNPRWPIRKTLTGPMELHRLGRDTADRDERAGRILEMVGMERRALSKFPHQFSGGERQRIAIARALAVQPEILICDEAVSALDVTVQVQVMDLLRDLQRELGIAYLFISHDLTAIRYMTDRLLVMRSGEIVEEGKTASVFEAPSHPYTSELLAAEPRTAGFL